MKTTVRVLLIASSLILSMSAYAAQEDKTVSKMENMKMMCPQDNKCPMSDQMGDMQTSMGGMMSGMQGMMEQMKDPAMKEKMQKMHKDMGVMMQNMKQMHEKMGMMGGAEKMPSTDGKKSDDVPEETDGADHEKHH